MAHHESEVNQESRRMLEKLFAKEAKRLGLGATNQFPEGRLTEGDEGELRLGIARKDEKIILNFGKPVAWIGFTPEQAKEIAYSLIEHANTTSSPLPSKPILCLDFDGVIHSYTSGWKGADVIPDPPVNGALAFVKEALECFSVCVFSSRSNAQGGIEAIRKWMRKHGFPIYNIDFPREKPPALVTIDDRALPFNGEWPEPAELLKFKPWNKKSV